MQNKLRRGGNMEKFRFITWMKLKCWTILFSPKKKRKKRGREGEMERGRKGGRKKKREGISIVKGRLRFNLLAASVCPSRSLSLMMWAEVSGSFTCSTDGADPELGVGSNLLLCLSDYLTILWPNFNQRTISVFKKFFFSVSGEAQYDKKMWHFGLRKCEI